MSFWDNYDRARMRTVHNNRGKGPCAHTVNNNLGNLDRARAHGK